MVPPDALLDAACDAFQDALALNAGDVAPACTAHAEHYDPDTGDCWVHVSAPGHEWARFRVVENEGKPTYTDDPWTWEWYDTPICARCASA